MRFLVILGIVVFMAGSALHPVYAGENSSYHQIKCPSGYSLQKSGPGFRCVKQNGFTVSTRKATCNNWKLTKVGDKWSCCAVISVASGCLAIDNKTCPWSGYNPKVYASSSAKTCEKKTTKYAYEHPFFH